MEQIQKEIIHYMYLHLMDRLPVKDENFEVLLKMCLSWRDKKLLTFACSETVFFCQVYKTVH